ncbi:Protein FAR1-RELATED SEQUENCE [Arachis hypogaea]|nr:Protein FAR1-RELATED SEQUENCE [Arachis hypogaea]
MRSREAQFDLQSIVGDVVLQSPLHDLERSVANMLTREIFLLFRPMLLRACTLKIRSCTYTPIFEIYTLSHSGSLHKEWRVSHYPNEEIYKCSCMRMESLGIPCDHVVAVLVHLDATELPKSLILDRWSKNARSRVRAFMDNGPFCWDSMVTCRNWMLSNLCRELCLLGSAGDAEFYELTDKFWNEIVLLKERKKGMQADRERTEPHAESTTLEGCIRNPLMVRHNKPQRRARDADMGIVVIVMRWRRTFITLRPEWTDMEYTSFFWDGDGGSDNFDMEIPVSNPYFSSQPYSSLPMILISLKCWW